MYLFAWHWGGGVGAGVFVSRYFGAGEYGKMKTVVSTSLLSFLILSIVLGVFGFCFSNPMMRALQTPADILDDAVLYLRVLFCGISVFVYVQYPFNDVHLNRGIKDSVGSTDIFFYFEYYYGSLDGGRAWSWCIWCSPCNFDRTGHFCSIFIPDLFFTGCANIRVPFTGLTDRSCIICSGLPYRQFSSSPQYQ